MLLMVLVLLRVLLLRQRQLLLHFRRAAAALWAGAVLRLLARGPTRLLLLGRPPATIGCRLRLLLCCACRALDAALRRQLGRPATLPACPRRLLLRLAVA